MKTRHRRLRIQNRMKLTDLPDSIFLDLIEYLSPREVVLCRCLSRDALLAFSRDDLSRRLLLLHFPRSLEGRLLKGLVTKKSDLVKQVDWPTVFAQVARRYYALETARPSSVEKVKLLHDPKGLRVRGVAPWNRFLRLDQKTADFHHWDAVWTYGTTEGLLVYPSEDGHYRARDLATGTDYDVPFQPEDKVVRRVRLRNGILIMEWCEVEGVHALNERTLAHRHFATAFDVAKLTTPESILPRYSSLQITGDDRHSEPAWTITFRSEWKIHYLGLPLSDHDRFFSAHNGSHYAAYLWQPNRSPWAGDGARLERLIVWDIGMPSPYRPSLDPGGKLQPADGVGPRIVLRLVNHELDSWGMRQGEFPSLRGLAFDRCTKDTDGKICGHVFFLSEEHCWAAGGHSNPIPPRLHQVRTTGIPLTGIGPAWVDDCGSDGDVNMSFCWRARVRSLQASPFMSADIGPSQDVFFAEEWPGQAPCWRHEDFPYLTVAEMVDSAAGVRISARRCFMLETLSVHVRPALRVKEIGGRGRAVSEEPGEGDSDVDELGGTVGGEKEVQFEDEMWSQMLARGCIAGDERWLIGEDFKGDVTIMRF